MLLNLWVPYSDVPAQKVQGLFGLGRDVVHVGVPSEVLGDLHSQVGYDVDMLELLTMEIVLMGGGTSLTANCVDLKLVWVEFHFPSGLPSGQFVEVLL